MGLNTKSLRGLRAAVNAEKEIKATADSQNLKKESGAVKRNSIASEMFSEPSVQKAEDEFTIYINIDDIIPNPLNAEEMSNIEELKASIEAVGKIQQNLVLKPKDENGKYMLLTGERRWTALRELVAEGQTQYQLAPAHIQELDDVGDDIKNMPENWRERYLIETTNVEQRRDNNPAQTMQRIERMKQLYKEMKEAGQKPKGRIRDLTANALGMSTQAVARYENVSKNATDEVKEEMAKGDLPLDSAIAIARNTPDKQSQILEKAKEIKNERLKQGDTNTGVVNSKNVSVQDVAKAEKEVFINEPEVEEGGEENTVSPSKTKNPKPKEDSKPPIYEVTEDDLRETIDQLKLALERYEKLIGVEIPVNLYKSIESGNKKIQKILTTNMSYMPE